MQSAAPISLNDKINQLTESIRDKKRVAIAFSGGVDSTLLLYAAYRTLGDNAMAITVDAPYIPRWELDEAADFCKKLKIRHTIIKLEIPATIQNNPSDRCYHCKLALFKQLQNFADQNGAALLDGTNYDDLDDYRPGMAALKELAIQSPLLEAELTKSEIRQISKEWNLKTAGKPAYACLLTRIPHATQITPEMLYRIEQAETAIIKLGFPAVRVRHYAELARIEIPTHQIPQAVAEPTRTKIVNAVRNAGYQFVTLDLAGYRMGSLNPAIEPAD